MTNKTWRPNKPITAWTTSNAGKPRLVAERGKKTTIRDITIDVFWHVTSALPSGLQFEVHVCTARTRLFAPENITILPLRGNTTFSICFVDYNYDIWCSRVQKWTLNSKTETSDVTSWLPKTTILWSLLSEEKQRICLLLFPPRTIICLPVS